MISLLLYYLLNFAAKTLKINDIYKYFTLLWTTFTTFLTFLWRTFVLTFTLYTLTIQPNMRSSAWCSPFTISMRALATVMWLVLPFRVAIGNRRWDGVLPIGYWTPCGLWGDEARGMRDRVPWLLWMFWQVMVLPDRRMVYSPVRTVSNTGFVVSSSKSSI